MTMYKNLKNIWLVVLVVGIMFGCSEEPFELEDTGTLTGVVVTSGDNVPLQNVKISTNPSSSTEFTDETGAFIIEDIVENQYSVQAELDGFATSFEAATITGGGTVNVVFELEIETANNQAVTKPELIAPEDNAVDVLSETQFIWSASDPDGDDVNYTVQIRNDADDEILEFSTVNDTMVDVTGLRFGLKYFWQVSAADSINKQEVLSKVSAFETINPSEDSNRFAFVREINGNDVIFASDGEGNEFQLTESTKNSFRPRRNRTANKIAFLANSNAETHIFTMNFDGSGIQQITSAVAVNGFDLSELDFSWTANGGRLLYSNFGRLYSINNDGSGLQQIYETTDQSFISEVAISADESIIALKTNDIDGYNVSIFTIDSTSGTVIDNVLSGVPGAAGGLDISVDNQRILYWYDVSGFEDPSYRQLDARIFVFNSSDSSVIDISDQKVDGTNDFDCRFSPNEAEVILTNTSNDGISQHDILRIDTDPMLTTNVGRMIIIENGEMPDFE